MAKSEVDRLRNFAESVYWTVSFKECRDEEWVPYIRNESDEIRRYWAREDAVKAAVSLLTGGDGVPPAVAVLINRHGAKRLRGLRAFMSP